MVIHQTFIQPETIAESASHAAILIVDDTPANLGLLSDLLDEAGFEVWVARDGESALRKVEYAPPDIILLDVMMPGIDGFETCKIIKAQPSTKDIPVIFMTALAETVDKVKGLSLGAVDYITKPFQQEEVLARLKMHLKLHFLTQTLEAHNGLLKREIAERIVAETALQKLTQELEQRVEERTAELTQALHDLQQSQVHLVQSEKLATLGQLVAGVAHEINNPVSFIFGNLSHTEQYVKNIIDHLELYQQYYPNPVSQIKQHAEEIDVEYLLEDLPKMNASMKVGIDRIRHISVSLRNFSRSDISSKVSVNIHEGIDSTLLILQHRLKGCGDRPAIKVIKEYGDLPAVACYPGQLNQVFMNLLANAIDALEEGIGQGKWVRGNEKETSNDSAPTIRIRTELLEGNLVAIWIADNGCGMTEEVKQRLFEPLFTTKPIGKGTGLGLSISCQIIEEKHSGRLTCLSSPGNGTEFAIAIPIQ